MDEMYGTVILYPANANLFTLMFHQSVAVGRSTICFRLLSGGITLFGEFVETCWRDPSLMIPCVRTRHLYTHLGVETLVSVQALSRPRVPDLGC